MMACHRRSGRVRIAIRCAALCLLISATAVAAPPQTAPPAASPVANAELESLCRALHAKDSSATAALLIEFARKHKSDALGPRAALALGYFDYTRGRLAEAAEWLSRAEQDPLLPDYALYWEALNTHAQHRTDEALEVLERIVREYPSSAIVPQVLEALASAALEANQPHRARFALEAYPKSGGLPSLLLLRARAREMDRAPGTAAADYVALYYQHPLAAEARDAGRRLEPMQRTLRQEFPAITPEMRSARAAAFYDARQWRQSKAEYQDIAKFLQGRDRERAMLRAAASSAQLREGPGTLEKLRLSDPEADAERYALLADVYRGRKKIEAMQRAVEESVSRAPHSLHAAEALAVAGNFLWSHLDRASAAGYYHRLLDATASGPLAASAHWRLAWVAYLDRDQQAAALLAEHVRRFPESSYLPEALYWLGRTAEHAGDAPRARAYFLKLAARFPQTYFGGLARERLREMGSAGGAAEENVPDLALIPPPRPLPDLKATLPPAAVARDARARALCELGFGASAELEWRAGYAETGAATLMVEAAQAALASGRIGASMMMIRQTIPQLEARRWEELPVAAWSAAYPLPYAGLIRAAAQRQGLDPMLVAGLIRQESAFQPTAVSRAKAVGLMQVLPGTGKRLARQLHVPFSRDRLFNPEYNLQLGTKYLANLIAMFGSVEPAVAAYDAGEDRILGWQAQRKYDEMAEFIESIPFTETREYVQIVTRNAAVYRRLEKAQP
jgi:soluble lytic murein transglycosylase